MPFRRKSLAVRNHRNAVRLPSESCPQSVGFRKLDHLGHFLGFVGNELAEVGWRPFRLTRLEQNMNISEPAHALQDADGPIRHHIAVSHPVWWPCISTRHL